MRGGVYGSPTDRIEELRIRQRWDIDELVESWTLDADELRWVASRSGASRLGFAVVLLKFFELEARSKIRARFGFRAWSDNEIDPLVDAFIAGGADDASGRDPANEAAFVWCRASRIEPPSAAQLARFDSLAPRCAAGKTRRVLGSWLRLAWTGSLGLRRCSIPSDAATWLLCAQNPAQSAWTRSSVNS